jgi:hypothetical protein
MRTHRFALVLGVGLLSGCIHNWAAYEPPSDSSVPFDNVMLDVQPIDIPRPDVPDAMDVQTPVDVVDTTPPADVVDVPPPIDIVDAPPPVDVPVVPDVTPVDVNPDAPCGSAGTACCAPALCAPGLLCRVDMTCGVDCPSPTMQCGSICLNTQTDPNNCGSCGTVCHGGRSCVGGSCM